QAGGIDVQTTDIDPATLFRSRQAIKHGRATFRVVTGADLAFRLVVDQHAAHALLDVFALEQLAVDADGVAQLDASPKGGDGAIDPDPAISDPLLDVTARAQAGAGQD